MAYPTNDALNGKLDLVYTAAGNAESDLAGVVPGADVLASQFTDVKNTMAYLQDMVDELRSNYWYVPVGLISPFAGPYANRPPAGWLFCDGSAVSQGTYASLYDVIGANAYGTDAGGNFFLPDLRSRVPIGQSSDVSGSAPSLPSGLSARARGTVYGAETLPAHTHSIDHDHDPFDTTDNAGAHTHTITLTQDQVIQRGSGTVFFRTWQSGSTSTSSAGAHNHNINVPNFTGTSGSAGSGSHGVVQPSLAVSFIIKY